MVADVAGSSPVTHPLEVARSHGRAQVQTLSAGANPHKPLVSGGLTLVDGDRPSVDRLHWASIVAEHLAQGGELVLAHRHRACCHQPLDALRAGRRGQAAGKRTVCSAFGIIASQSKVVTVVAPSTESVACSMKGAGGVLLTACCSMIASTANLPVRIHVWWISAGTAVVDAMLFSLGVWRCISRQAMLTVSQSSCYLVQAAPRHCVAVIADLGLGLAVSEHRRQSAHRFQVVMAIGGYLPVVAGGGIPG